MTKVGKFLDASDIENLKALKNRKLEYIKHAPIDVSGSVLRVVEFVSGGSSYYLYCDTEPTDYFGDDEDITYLEFSTERYPFVDMMDKCIENHIGLVVSGIEEIKDTIRYYENSEISFEYSFTRGLIFSFGEYQLALEKISEFSELIAVRKGYDLLSSFEPVDDYIKDFEEGSDVRVSRRVEIIS